MHENISGRSLTSPSVVIVPSLSDELRTRTVSLHGQIEVLLGLPGVVRTRDDYVAWLGRFLALYEPLEHALAAFPAWEALALAAPSPSHTVCLAGDLAALGIDPGGVPRAAPASLPALPTVAHVLGALYVLEGATLGGRLILRDLRARLGAPIAGATRFFGGRGEAVGPMWQSVRAALDAFGRAQPQLCADVIEGAERTFRAMLDWFAPFVTVGRS
jgi:heme oxygenase